MNKTKITKYIFLITLGLEVLAGYAIGLFALIDFPTALETGFSISHNPSLDILGIIIGLALIFVATMSVAGIYFTMKNNIAGVVVGIAAGLYVFLFGALAFLLLGDTQALIVDSIRGALTVVSGVVIYRNLRK